MMAELQEERKGIDEDRAAMERERERIREEEQANVRREMMVNMINGGSVPVGSVPGGGGGVAVAERPAVAGGDGGSGRVNGDGKASGYGAGPVGRFGDGPDEEPAGDENDGPDDVREESDRNGVEEFVFEDGAGFVAFEEGEFGVYDGPDVEVDVEGGSGENGVMEAEIPVEPGAVAQRVDGEAVVEAAVVEPKSREEWLAVAGLVVPPAPVEEDSTEGPGGLRIDRFNLDDYLSGRDQGAVGAGSAVKENGVRERGAGSEEDGLGSENGHAPVVAVPVEDGEDRVPEGTRDVEAVSWRCRGRWVARHAWKRAVSFRVM